MKDTTVVLEGDKVAELKPGVHQEIAGEGERVFNLEGGLRPPRRVERPCPSECHLS